MPSVALVTLIEDDLPIQRALARALEQRGHVVQAFGAPARALSEMTSRPPDVVILDLGLPDLDGVEVLKMFRAVHDVPVIVASARDSERLSRQVCRLARRTSAFPAPPALRAL